MDLKTIIGTLIVASFIFFYGCSTDADLSENLEPENSRCGNDHDSDFEDFDFSEIYPEVQHLAPDGSQYLEREDEDEKNRIVADRIYASQGEVQNITYYLRPSILDDGGTCADGWEQAAHEATAAYNLLDSKIKFVHQTTESGADINIGCDDDLYFWSTIDNRIEFYDIGTDGRARPPGSDRKVGKYISINNTATGDTKKGLMIHEFGHTLGFKHTNQGDGVHITCGYQHNYTEDQGLSIMRSVVNRNEFHHTDRTSIGHLWPKSLEQPANRSVQRLNDYAVRFRFTNPNDTYKPYTEIVLAHWKDDTWEVARFWCDAPDSAGNYDINWWAPTNLFAPGQGFQQFWVKGVSHEEEVASSWGYLGSFTP